MEMVLDIWDRTGCRPSWYGMEQAMVNGHWTMVEFLMRCGISCSMSGLYYLLSFGMARYHSHTRYFILTQRESELRVLPDSLRVKLIELAYECYDVHVLILLQRFPFSATTFTPPTSNALPPHEPWTYQQVESAPTIYSLFMSQPLTVTSNHHEHGFHVPTPWVLDFLGLLLLTSRKAVAVAVNPQQLILMFRQLHSFHGSLSGECARLVAGSDKFDYLHDLMLHWKYFFKLSDKPNANEIQRYQIQQEYILRACFGLAAVMKSKELATTFMAHAQEGRRDEQRRGGRGQRSNNVRSRKTELGIMIASTSVKPSAKSKQQVVVARRLAPLLVSSAS